MSFPRYPQYKQSAVEWLGDVPAHWEVVPLKRLSRLLTDKASVRHFPVALENIESATGRLVESSTEFQGEGTAFEPGDLLFGKLRPYLAKVWLADTAGEAVGDFHVMRPGPAFHGRFLQYSMLSRDFIAIVDGSTFGSKMPRASWEFVGGMPICVPSRSEQDQIAAFLDRETAKIDALVAEQERLIELLKEKRQAIISHAVTKGLDPNVPMRDSAVEWIGVVPRHWTVVRVKWVARMDSGHTPDKKVGEYWEGGRIPWVSLNDTGYLKNNDYIANTAVTVTEIGLANSSAHLLPERAVVFSRDATIGRCAITTRPMAVSQHFIAWICGERVVPEYLLMCLRSMADELERLATGATLKTIGMPEVRTLAIPLPPIEEQKHLIEHSTAQATLASRLLADTQQTIRLLLERRSTLISAAVTGRIDICNAVPGQAA